MARLAHRLSLGDKTIEKDYVLTWLLLAIANSPLRDRLAFKGGTAIKKVYEPGYRFSEDLDFTLLDDISTVTITAADVAGDEMQLVATSWSVDGGGFTSGLPGDLIVSAESCAVVSDNNTCTWVLSGTVSVSAGEYTVRATIADEDGGQTEFDISLTVLPEETMVRFKGSNPVGVLVETPGGDRSQFALSVDLSEHLPDQPFDRAGPGDISLAEVSMRLAPVGPGSPVEGVCTPDTVTGTDYDAKLPVSCSFDAVPVNTYLVEVSVGGGYYAGSGEDVLAVYDPSLGYATGSGWFYWPGTETPENGYLGDRTNFSFTMTYNKKGKKVKGSLLIIRHLADGSIYRIKSNALENLALGEDGQPSFGWATISGKSTYLEPGWDEAEGNHDFLVYVEDGNEPGSGPDRFWLEMKGKGDVIIPAMSMEREATENAVTLADGDIVVPRGSNIRALEDIVDDGKDRTIFLPIIIKAEPSVSTQENSTVPTATPEPTSTPLPSPTVTATLPPTVTSEDTGEPTATPTPESSVTVTVTHDESGEPAATPTPTLTE